MKWSWEHRTLIQTLLLYSLLCQMCCQRQVSGQLTAIRKSQTHLHPITASSSVTAGVWSCLRFLVVFHVWFYCFFSWGPWHISDFLCRELRVVTVWGDKSILCFLEGNISSDMKLLINWRFVTVACWVDHSIGSFHRISHYRSVCLSLLESLLFLYSNLDSRGFASHVVSNFS